MVFRYARTLSQGLCDSPTESWPQDQPVGDAAVHVHA